MRGMGRFIFWGFVWLLTFATIDLRVEYTDGVEIEYSGWLKYIFR
jgi:hypothetical protein